MCLQEQVVPHLFNEGMKFTTNKQVPKRGDYHSGNATFPCVLVVSATDSGGCAGMMADLRVCAAMRVFAVCSVSAVTAQNSNGVADAMAVNPYLVSAQMRCACEQQFPDAVKIGLLPDEESFKVVGNTISELGLTNVVLDTVAGATAGKICSCGTPVWREALLHFLPKCDIITPNLPELQLLTGLKVITYNDIFASVNWLRERGFNRYLLVKGGHNISSGSCVDMLFCPDCSTPLTYTADKTDTHNLRGTGCSLSTAIACYLAKGYDVPQAVFEAHLYLQDAIRTASKNSYCGIPGPIEHFPYNS